MIIELHVDVVFYDFIEGVDLKLRLSGSRLERDFGSWLVRSLNLFDLVWPESFFAEILGKYFDHILGFGPVDDLVADDVLAIELLLVEDEAKVRFVFVDLSQAVALGGFIAEQVHDE